MPLLAQIYFCFVSSSPVYRERQ